MSSLAARRQQMDIMFIRDVHRHTVDSPFLLSRLPLAQIPHVVARVVDADGLADSGDALANILDSKDVLTTSSSQITLV